MDVMDRINAALAAPKTHVVVTTLVSNGMVYERRHEERSLRTAELHAEMERCKIGRDLIGRDANLNQIPVRVLSVEVQAL